MVPESTEVVVCLGLFMHAQKTNQGRIHRGIGRKSIHIPRSHYVYIKADHMTMHIIQPFERQSLHIWWIPPIPYLHISGKLESTSPSRQWNNYMWSLGSEDTQWEIKWQCILKNFPDMSSNRTNCKWKLLYSASFGKLVKFLGFIIFIIKQWTGVIA